ncbi:MAG: tryptophan-rich sensory protein [Brevundimonas sp.]|nr:tryptophan-rich sensory protein [Brevundimonas sp.]
MTDIDDVFDDAKDAALDFVNGEDRSVGHVLLGVAVTAGFALAATFLAQKALTPRLSAEDLRSGARPVTERPRGPMSMIVPAVFSATSLSAVRVWNAPSQPRRNAALGLWAATQAVNALWLAARPAGRVLQIGAAMASAGLAAAFAHEARRLDPDAGKLAAPIGGGTRVLNTLDRKVDEARATLH